ncbi:MAG: hypothetical protein J6W76_07875, partial [Spirochaetales bacterium]|nr:hypothetical protein [Spirochaetales bacterium]
MKKITPYATILTWLVISLIFFAITIITLHDIMRHNDERILLDKLLNEKDKTQFTYNVLNHDQDNLAFYSMNIAKSE